MFKNQPKGLIPAALSNMGERFGYYIMNAVLVLFLCSKFGLAEETAGIIYSVFYAGIYILSLLGGVIADKTQNYKGTIIWGLVIMTIGYIVLAVPVFGADFQHMGGILALTCVALFFIAFGNGLFKGNLQAIVGQLYDDPRYAAQRDSGFQIFYVFINIGGLVAPFIAPLLRSWWLETNGMFYDAAFPAICHQMLSVTDSANSDLMNQLYALLPKVTEHADLVAKASLPEIQAFCTQYLTVFNTGVHYSFIASVAAMLISLVVFVAIKKGLPSPAKKAAVVTQNYTAKERKTMADEIRQRMYALFAVLGIAIFFWFSFHQNGTSLSLFARDFVVTATVPPEIWQAINPFFVIVLTPLVMLLFTSLSKRGRELSTPKKIAIGMGLATLGYLFLIIISLIHNYPSGETFRGLTETVRAAMKSGPWVLILFYFFMTVAELFISPLGLSFVSKVAPKHMQGLCQGLWLGATAVGNLLLWIGPLMYNSWPLWLAWTVFAVVCLVSMGTMFGMLSWLERVTNDTADDIKTELDEEAKIEAAVQHAVSSEEKRLKK